MKEDSFKQFQQMKSLEAQQFEEVWQKTLSSGVSNAVLLYSQEKKVISFNQKVKDFVEPITSLTSTSIPGKNKGEKRSKAEPDGATSKKEK